MGVRRFRLFYTLSAKGLSRNTARRHVNLTAVPPPLRGLKRAHNSAVECHLHTVEVAGSNPAAPTIKSITYKGITALAAP